MASVGRERLMKEDFKVLIVGGGIAGMSLAIRLGEMGISTDLIDKEATIQVFKP